MVRLGVSCIVFLFVVVTMFFSGNYPPYASVEACGVEEYPSPDELARAEWSTLVPQSPLTGDHRNEFPVDAPERYTHVRLSIYPDGGVARLRVHGEPVPDPGSSRLAWSTWPRPNTAGWPSSAATCSTPPRTTCCCPDPPARWARVGRPRAGATTATTGYWSASQHRAGSAWSSWTPATSRATPPVRQHCPVWTIRPPGSRSC